MLKKKYGNIFIYTSGFISLKKIETYKEFIKHNKDKSHNYYTGKILGYNCSGKNIGKNSNNETGISLNYGFSDNGNDLNFTWKGVSISGKIYSEICQELPNFKPHFNKFKKIANELDLGLIYKTKVFPFILYEPDGMFISSKRIKSKTNNYFTDVVNLIKNKEINCFISNRMGGKRKVNEITFYNDDYKTTRKIKDYVYFESLDQALMYAKLKNILPFMTRYDNAEKYIRKNYPFLGKGFYLIYI